MTGAQNSYLHTLASEAKEQVEEDLTKAEAFKKLMSYNIKQGGELPTENNKSVFVYFIL